LKLEQEINFKGKEISLFEEGKKELSKLNSKLSFFTTNIKKKLLENLVNQICLLFDDDIF
jgi:hypothetical protein